MPAIQITRLRTQIAQLAALYGEPDQFLRSLHDLLDFYNDRTYRPGQAGQIQSLLPHYRVPLPVMRQIEIELAHLCVQDPQTGLRLADTLWMDPYLEPRLLAIHLVSLAPVSPPEPVVERLTAWAQPTEDREVLNALIRRGMTHLLSEHPDRWSTLIKNWLTDENSAIQSMGLHALLATVENESFQNLPIIYHLLSPIIQNPPANLQANLLAVLQALAKRSPSETAYFLRQVLILGPNHLVPRMVRRCFPYLSPENQESLRQVLKTREP